MIIGVGDIGRDAAIALKLSPAAVELVKQKQTEDMKALLEMGLMGSTLLEPVVTTGRQRTPRKGTMARLKRKAKKRNNIRKRGGRK